LLSLTHVAFLVDGSHTQMFRRIILLQRCRWAKGFNERLRSLRSQNPRRVEMLLEVSVHTARVQWASRSLGFVLFQVLALVLFHSQSYALCLLLVKQNVMLHLLEVHLIVKVNNVLRVPCLLVNYTFCVNLCYIFFVLEAICVLVDDRVESYLLLI